MTAAHHQGKEGGSRSNGGAAAAVGLRWRGRKWPAQAEKDSSARAAGVRRRVRRLLGFVAGAATPAAAIFDKL